MSAKAETFGEYLKRLRGKTPQGKLAAAIGKTTMYISNIEKALQKLTMARQNVVSGNFCPECGASASGNFCSSCGKKLK